MKPYVGTADEIAANEPQLAGRFSDGLYLPTEGQLDGRQVLNALADALESMNVACHWSCEREVEDLGGAIRLGHRLPRLWCKERVEQAV